MKRKTTENKAEAESSKKSKEVEGLEIGNIAPAIELPNQSGEVVRLSDLEGKWVVVYFYPKDNTPGCTKEAKNFQSLLPEFTALNAVILGVSADSTKSHTTFCSKQGLEFDLLSDTERVTIRAYGAAKNSTSVRRSTVLINPSGHIAHVWSTVSGAEKHPAAVLAQLEQIAK
jgi:thioredoxin-dependent peroxiredoxin